MRDMKRRNPVSRPKKVATATAPSTKVLRRQLLIGLGLFILIALLVTGIWHGSRVESLQINEVAVMGGVTIPHQRVRDATEEALVGTYLSLVPKRFNYLYPKNAIESAVMSIPRVKHVHVERSKRTVTVAFDEYQPQALWCASVDSPDCLFIDQTGLAFAVAPNLTGGAFVRYVTDDAPELFASLVPAAFLKETNRFVELAEDELSLFVTHVVKLGDHDIEYHVSGGGRVKVSQTISSAKSFANLQTILLSEDFRHLEPGSFNYIDLRFGDKVFVNEVTEEIATSTASST